MNKLIERIKLDRIITDKLNTLKQYGGDFYYNNYKIIYTHESLCSIYIKEVEIAFGVKYDKHLHNRIIEFIDNKHIVDYCLRIYEDYIHGYAIISLEDYEKTNR